jgi:hypothetical protein
MTAAAPLGSVTKRAPPAPRVLDLGQSKGVQAPAGDSRRVVGDSVGWRVRGALPLKLVSPRAQARRPAGVVRRGGPRRPGHTGQCQRGPGPQRGPTPGLRRRGGGLQRGSIPVAAGRSAVCGWRRARRGCCAALPPRRPGCAGRSVARPWTTTSTSTGRCGCSCIGAWRKRGAYGCSTGASRCSSILPQDC